MLSENSKATPAQIKRHNEALILREIYARETISRVQLARLTHLSRPSVSELAQSLIEKGLIYEVGPEQALAKVGKKAQMLAFNPDAYQFVGIAVTNATVIGALFNLRMQHIAQHTLPLDGTTGNTAVHLLMQVIEYLMRCATRPLLGIALGTPGIVDTQNGVINLAANLGWRNLPLGQMLHEHFQTPVYIGNDSNFAVVGEYHFGQAKGVKDLVLVQAGEGIGVGILSDGRIIQGSTHAAGELGHTPLPGLDETCLCGQQGCLETIVSWWAIKRHAQQIVQEHPETLLARLANGSPIINNTIQQALAQGDPYVLALIEKAATYLGYALTLVIHLLNPKRIVLTGSILELGDLFSEQVQRAVKRHTLPHIANDVEITAHSSDDQAILFGAGAFLLEQELGL